MNIAGKEACIPYQVVSPLAARMQASYLSTMNRQEELAVGRRLFGHIEGRTTDLADECSATKVINYSCRERAELERTRLFHDRPIFMGSAHGCPSRATISPRRWPACRCCSHAAPTGEGIAFANICRHRGAPVARGAATPGPSSVPTMAGRTTSRASCSGTTDKVGFAGLDLASHGLGAAALAEKHGMLYRPRPSPADGRKRGDRHRRGLGPMAADLAALSSRPSRNSRPIA